MSASFFSFFSFFKIFKFPNNFTPRFFSSLNFLNLTNSSLSIVFIFILFSFAGIPPLAGFFAKFFVLYSAISFHFFILVFTLLIFNCIACFYYINLIRKNYFISINFSYLPVVFVFNQKFNAILLICLAFFILLICLDFDIIFLFSNLLISTLLN